MFLLCGVDNLGILALDIVHLGVEFLTHLLQCSVLL